jgi:hypothetical protein
MNKLLYRELKVRLRENRALGRGGVGRWSASRRIAQGLAVDPWRVIIPMAVAISLVSWLVNKQSLTGIILRLFGGS